MPNKRRGRAAVLFPRGTEITERENRAHPKQDGRFVSSDEKRGSIDATIRASAKGGEAEDHRAGNQRYDGPGDRELTQLAVRSGNAAGHAQG